MLPLGFTELEYLESTGTQWIDTGYVLTGDETLEFEAQCTDIIKSSSYDSFFTGCQNSNTDKGGFWVEKYLRNNGNWQWYVRYNSLASVYTTQTGAGLNQRNKLSISSRSFKVDGIEILQPLDASTHQDTSITIFGRKQQSGIIAPSLWRCWYYRITKNNSVIKSYIPALRNSDGEIGMFDEVTGTFFTNQGTGKFVAGPKVLVSSGKEVVMKGNIEVPSFKSIVMKKLLPEGYERVEYIESHGEEYIDSGIQVTNNTEYYIDWICKSTGSNYIYASRVGSEGIYGVSGSSSGQTIGFSFSGVSKYFTTRRENNREYILSAKSKNGTATAELLDVVLGISEEVSFSYVYSVPNANVFLFGNNISQKSANAIKRAKLIVNDVLVRDFIPCKHNNEYGLYDLVSKQFFTNQGTGAFTGGPVVSDLIPVISYKSIIKL